MHKLTTITIILFIFIISACQPQKEPAALVVENYLSAIVNKDADKISVLSCADWVDSAMLDLDAFQGVEARLDGLQCAVSGTEDPLTLVKCQGAIVATYNNEEQKFDLNTRTYLLSQFNGDWLVCGTR